MFYKNMNRVADRLIFAKGTKGKVSAILSVPGRLRGSNNVPKFQQRLQQRL
jgi:hypothetical protein